MYVCLASNQCCEAVENRDDGFCESLRKKRQEKTCIIVYTTIPVGVQLYVSGNYNMAKEKRSE